MFLDQSRRNTINLIFKKVECESDISKPKITNVITHFSSAYNRMDSEHDKTNAKQRNYVIFEKP